MVENMVRFHMLCEQAFWTGTWNRKMCQVRGVTRESIQAGIDYLGRITKV